MNAFNTVAVFLTVAVAAAGPFVAVHIGGRAYGDLSKPEAARIEHDDADDTTEIPRITNDRYMY